MDVGNSEVLVAVRDGSHAGPGGSDDYEIAAFSIINLNLPPVITSLASNVISPQPIGATVLVESLRHGSGRKPCVLQVLAEGSCYRRILEDGAGLVHRPDLGMAHLAC